MSSATQRSIAKNIDQRAGREEARTVKYAYGTVTDMFAGSGIIPSSLSVEIIAGTINSGIPYAKGVGITIGDRVLLLDLGGIYFAVVAVQP